MSDFAAASAFLDARIGLGVQPGLERIRGLMEAFADPHLAVPIIHVAGTNGKTSVVHFIASVLSAQGLTVGTFVSPHLESIEQRYGIGTASLTRDRFADLVTEAAPIIELYEARSGTGVTYFEVTAALAFSLFASFPVAVGVVEVGLGGRLDATNVVEPEVAVITSIGLDHMSYLGDSIPAIAAEKAAIIKEGSLVVTGDLDEESDRVISERVAAVGTQRFRLGTDFTVTSAVPAVGGWVVDIEGVYGSHHELQLRSHGRHQVDNFAVAVAAAEVFGGRQLGAEVIEAAADTSVPGRMEVLDTAPLLMIDGAHNAPAAAALAAALEREFPSTTWSLVFGVMDDKARDEMLAALAPRVDTVYAVSVQSPRAVAAEELARSARAAGLEAAPYPSVAEGLAAAVSDAGDNGAVLVAGSLYVAGEARSAYRSSR